MTAWHWDDRLGAVAAAVHYFATDDDQEALLDYLDEPTSVTLHPWLVVRSPLDVLLRSDALVTQQVMVVHNALGPPTVIRPGDRAMEEGTKSGVFNRINWEVPVHHRLGNTAVRLHSSLAGEVPPGAHAKVGALEVREWA
jgi:hypothetical protein